MDRWDLEEHLLDAHLFDDTAVDGATDEELEKDHEEAHRVGQLIWREHAHEGSV